MPAAHWAPAAILLAGFTGAGALCVEIMTETGLQRTLDDEVFGRAYGLALPASIGGIAVGSLIAPILVSAFGETAALLACGAVVTSYCAVVWRSRPTETTMQAAAAPLPGAPTVPAPRSARRAGPCRWPAPDGARAPVVGGTAGAGAHPGRRRPHQLNAGLPPGGMRGRAGSSPWMAAVHGSDRGPGGKA